MKKSSCNILTHFFYIVKVFALERQQRGDGNDEEKAKVNDINGDSILGR